MVWHQVVPAVASLWWPPRWTSPTCDWLHIEGPEDQTFSRQRIAPRCRSRRGPYSACLSSSTWWMENPLKSIVIVLLTLLILLLFILLYYYNTCYNVIYNYNCSQLQTRILRSLTPCLTEFEFEFRLKIAEYLQRFDTFRLDTMQRTKKIE